MSSANAPTLLVLAAGMGSRYGGLKQIEAVGPSGETIIDYSIFDAMRAGFGKLVFVIRKDIEEPFKEVVGSRFEKRIKVEYVFQELDKIPSPFKVPEGRTKPWGTTQAILAAARLLIEFHINEAAYRYPAALADAVEVAATLAGWTEAGKSAVLANLEKIEVPRFPLSGRDLIQRGIQPGPALGAELDRLERKWIASGFRLDRLALLADLQR